MTEPAVQSRWILYHGTSTLRLRQIRQDNVLRMSPTGDVKVALTPERAVAACFALNAMSGDLYDNPIQVTRPVILVLDGEALVALGYALESYSDQVWGAGECDWENELASRDDIEPLHEVLVRIEKVPLDFLEIWLRGKHEQVFGLPRPWICDRIKARTARHFRKLCDDALTGDAPAPVDGLEDYARIRSKHCTRIFSAGGQPIGPRTPAGHTSSSNIAS